MLTTSEIGAVGAADLATLPDDELKARAIAAREQLTEQQQALIAWNSRVQTRRSMRTYRRNAIAGFLILLVGIGAGRYIDVAQLNTAREAVVDSGNAVIVSSCNRDFRTALAQRQQLYKEPQRGDEPKLSEKERDKIVRRLTPLPDCRTAKGTLTDNPDKKVREPAPLHEGLVGERGKLLGG